MHRIPEMWDLGTGLPEKTFPLFFLDALCKADDLQDLERRVKHTHVSGAQPLQITLRMVRGVGRRAL